MNCLFYIVYPRISACIEIYNIFLSGLLHIFIKFQEAKTHLLILNSFSTLVSLCWLSLSLLSYLSVYVYFFLSIYPEVSAHLFSCSSDCCSRIVLCICLGFILAHIRLFWTRCTLSAATVAFCDFSALLLFLWPFPSSSIYPIPYPPHSYSLCPFCIAFKLIAVNHIFHFPLLRIRPVAASSALSLFVVFYKFYSISTPLFVLVFLFDISFACKCLFNCIAPPLRDFD